jgi:hypothetical protein
MNNYSILQQNALDGFSETAQILYIKLLDVFEAHSSKKNERRAFLAASYYEDRGGGVIDYILGNYKFCVNGKDIDAKTKTELKMFFSERYRHNIMKG